MPALAVGSNAIGSITNTSFQVTQSTASNLLTTSLGQFTRDGSPQTITLDTTTPSNNRGLPVVLLSAPSSAPLDTNSGAASAATLRNVLATRHEAAATPLALRLSDGSAFISTSNPVPIRSYTLPSSVSTVTFTINNAASTSDTIDIGAGFTLLALIFPAAFTAADLLFNVHPTTSGSVCQKLTVAGGAFRLSGIPTAAASNYRLPATDFLGDRFIQLSSVTVGGTSAVNQGASRSIVGLIGVL